jgi:hypothetical protein
MSSVAQVQEEAAPAGRSAVAKVLEFWSRVRNHVWRAIYLLGVLAFLLPFVTVKGCDSGEVTYYRGFELIAEDFKNGGWAFLVPICLGLAFFALSFLRRQRGQILQGFFKGWRVLFASVAALIVLIGPIFHFFFDDVTPRIGYIVGGTCWSLVYLASFIGVCVQFWRLTRSRASPPCVTGWGTVLLRALHYLLAVGIFYFVVVEELLAYRAYGASGDLLFVLVLLFISIPVFLLLHFAAEGIRMMERWALVWGGLLSFCLLAAGIVSSVIAVRTDGAIWLALLLPVTCFVAVVLAGSLIAVVTFARAGASQSAAAVESK